MNQDLEALKSVQAEDSAIRAIDQRLASLEPRVQRLDAERRGVMDARDRTAALLDRERTARTALGVRMAEHRAQLERNVQVLGDVRKQREALAADAQVAMAREVVGEEEREHSAAVRRVADLESALAGHDEALAELEARQAEARAGIADERAALQQERDTVRARRDAAAAGVARQLLSQYERIASRRHDEALFPLRGRSCGSCDTAVPLQRRNAMLARQSIEVCEACGALLYAAP